MRLCCILRSVAFAALFTIRFAANAQAHNGYTSPQWRDVIYRTKCSNFALFGDVVIANDNENCSVSTALLLLFRQSFRYNKHKWNEDIRHTDTRLTRMLYAHEITTRNQDATVRYHVPKTTCMLSRNATPSNLVSPQITAVTVLSTDHQSVTFAAFGAPTLSAAYVTVQQHTNGTTHVAVDEAFGLHAVNNHSPSAAFLCSHELAVGNAGWNDYDVILYKKNNKNYTNKGMTSPFRIGGENIGSLFEWNNNVYLSARLNVPYVPLDVTGHGYRSIGLYKVDASNATSELVDWIAPDACVQPCLDRMHHSCEDGVLTVNASAVLSCLPTMTSGFIHETTYGNCFRQAVTNMSDACMQRKQEKFVEGLLCAHRCRVDNQLYQPSVAPIDGTLYGVTSRTSWLATAQENNTTPSPIHFCRLSKSFAWNPACFDVDAASMRDMYGTPGHAMTSQLVKAGGFLYLGSPSLKSPIADIACSAVLHKWNASLFSYIEFSKPNEDGNELILPDVVLPDSRQFQLLFGCDKDKPHQFDKIKVAAFNRITQCHSTNKINEATDAENMKLFLMFETDCVGAKFDLHIVLPNGCRFYGLGPLEVTH